MLVCSVSLRPPRRTIAADLAEVATADDSSTTGQAIFATLVDDPASVADIVDAYLGEIMAEAASATDTVDAGYVLAADILETATGADTQNGTITPAPTGATFNPSDLANGVLSNGNLTFTDNAGGNAGARATTGYSTGKYYYEMTIDVASATGAGPCLAPSSATFNILPDTPKVGVAESNGQIWVGFNPVGTVLGATTNGTIYGVAVDLGAKLIWFRVAPTGNWNGSGTANPATATGGISISALTMPLYPMFVTNTVGNKCTANFGASAFSGSVPSGFTSGWP